MGVHPHYFAEKQVDGRLGTDAGERVFAANAYVRQRQLLHAQAELRQIQREEMCNGTAGNK